MITLHHHQKKNNSFVLKVLFIFITLSFFFACPGNAKVKEYNLKVVKEYPHERNAYTQGLFFYDGDLYESTGQFGESSFRRVDLNTGKAAICVKFNKKYFAEGSVRIADNIYILTWTNRVAFIYDAITFERKSIITYPREGWGLTTDGKDLIASDGSSRLYFMDERYKLRKTVNVTLNGRSLNMLNELEYIDGKIWANVYLTDMLVIINPESGIVEGMIDCTDLLGKKYRNGKEDVLNCNAYDAKTNSIFLTGKYCNKLFEIRLIEKQ